MWGMNPESVAALGTVVAAVSVIVAIVAAWRANKQNRKDRTLQAFVVLSMDIRQRWEGGWRQFLREDLPGMSDEKKRSPEVVAELESMLNWLDWMGLIVKMELIDEDLLLGTLRPVIRDILRESAGKIQSDIEDPDKGEDWWANVLYLARLADDSFDIGKAAREQVAKASG